MSPLRKRMLEDMQLRGLSARTQEAYARAVWQLAQHYHRSPEQLSDEELSAASIQDISIDHHRRHVFVTQRFLDRADLIAILQQIGPMESHRSRTPSLAYLRHIKPRWSKF
jgi:hypothetical protein